MMSFRVRLMVAVLVISFGQDVVSGATINVPGNHPTIQAGIDAAISGVDEVVVDDGCYFELINFGGKAITVRSVNGAAVTIIDGGGGGRVVTCSSGETATTVLDGFTITNGAGMLNNGTSPTVTNCTFSGNTILLGFGGGAGMKNDAGASPTVTNCVFDRNHTESRGGGMANIGSSPTVTNCVFSGNSARFTGIFTASGSGGGMVNDDNSNPTVTNCTFRGNSAWTAGGGMHNSNSNPTVTNCTFRGNTVIFRGGGMNNNSSSPTVTNCIFWENSDESGQGASAQIHTVSGTPLVNYTDLQGGWTGAGGTGNLDADPLFFNATLNNLRLSVGSICIDAGDNSIVTESTDLDGSPRILNGTVDIGAYESCSGTDLDSDGDGVCDVVDACPGFDDGLDDDSDGVPDACDVCFGNNASGDNDGDGVCDDLDACPDFDDSLDADTDGVPDDCDICPDGDDSIDTDGDGVPNDCDICPGSDDSPDADSDGVPDGCDACPGFDDSFDADTDGVPDECDACPGFDDSLDDDGDGVPDACDVCLGDNASGDNDADGVCNDLDACPGFDDSIDADSDGVPDECDVCPGFDDSLDDDSDGIPDACDACPTLPGVDCDVIEGNVTWTMGSVMNPAIPVAVAGTLTIEPDVTVNIQPDQGFWVLDGGTLMVNGTESQPVVFTSANGSPACTDWLGIVFQAGSDGVMTHAVVEYARTGIRIEDASPTIQDCIIREICGQSGQPAYGIFVTGNSTAGLLANTIDTVRGGAGLGVSGASTLRIGGLATGVFVGNGAQPTLDGNVIAGIRGGGGGQGPGAAFGSCASGGRGGLGGDAVGLHVDASLVIAADQLIYDVVAGRGGNGGNGQNAGDGGQGGNATGILANGSTVTAANHLVYKVLGGAGGGGGGGQCCGTFCGNDGNGGDGGDGGNAVGLAIDSSVGTFVGNTIVVEGGGPRGAAGPGQGDTGHDGFPGSAGQTDGLFATNNATVDLRNCILVGPSGRGIRTASGAVVDSTYTDIWGFDFGLGGGSGDISADPRFQDPANGDYRLGADSPCIDAGDNTAVPAGVTTDLDGNPRVVDDGATPDTGNGSCPLVDMGAFEFPSFVDSDGDGVDDGCDICPGFDDTLDADADGVPDGCDICPDFDDTVDADADGVPDGCDICPGFDDTLDADADDIPDGCDICPGSDDALDADLDGVPDGCDPCPLDNPDDTDSDGVCDSADICPGSDDTRDADADGVPDDCDNCPMTSNPDQANADAEGIIAAWRFDEGDGITALDSVGSTDGTLSGATYVSDGLGYVMDFDGNDDLVNFGDIDVMDSPGAFSVAMRFLRRSEINNPTFHGIRNVLVAQSSNATNDNLELGSSGGSISLYLHTAGVELSANISVGSPIQDNTWYHLVLTYDENELPNELKLYINGAIGAERADWGGPLVNSVTSPLTIGVARPGVADPLGDFDGQVDDVVLFDRALKLEEVQLLFADGVNAVSDGFGDACDICLSGDDSVDTDSDGVPDACDICPGFDDNGPDADADGVPDACDGCPEFDDSLDADSDGVPDLCDTCPNSPNAQNIRQGLFYGTIQAAISAAVQGDVIELGACTFDEWGFVLDNLDITLRGRGRDQTIIDGGLNGRVFLMQNGDDSVLEDLTIRRGVPVLGNGGAAVQAFDTSNLIFRRVDFRDCDGTGYRVGAVGGISFGTTMAFESCRFLDNLGDQFNSAYGGFASVSFVNCLFAGNGGSPNTVNPWGPCEMVNCTFADNTDDWAFNRFGFTEPAEVRNCVFDGANPTGSVESGITVTTSLFPGAPAGNIDGVPTFVDAVGGNYRLAAGSLGIDAADYDAYTAAGGGPTDLGGNDRLADDTCTADTGSGAFTYLDVGAYELQGATDSDDDGVLNGCDVCPGFDDNLDVDSDGVPDGCDACPGFDDSLDADSDGVADGCDACPDFDDSLDADSDGVPDGCDVCLGDDATGDSDGDDVCNDIDACPGFDDSLDADSDGVADGCDACPDFDDSLDADSDGVADGCDACPGFDDSLDTDSDGVADGCDACPGFDDTVDSDGDGVADGCDVCLGDDATGNSDGDAVCNDIDACPGFDDSLDTDSDGVADGCDACPGFDDNALVNNVTQVTFFATIQAAIDAAAANDVIEAAPCTYYENINFGGQAITLRSTDPTNPAVVAATIIDGGGSGTVVTCNNGETSATVLDGFTITNGSGSSGGGMLTQSSSPTVMNCTFNGNTATTGGGMSNIFGSPTVTNCTFSGNTATDSGGGMSNFLGGPTVTNCTFSGNTVTTGSFGGGGMANVSSNPTVTNCTFNENTATNNVGGGMWNSTSSPTVTNCILWENSDVGGMDESAQIHTAGGTPTVDFSDVQGGWAGAGGTGNINADPLFVDPDGADNTVGTDDDDVRLSAGSPCIDVGDDSVVTESTDLDGNTRIIGCAVDMGAYENQTPSSDSDGDGVPDGCDVCLGDDATGDSDADGVCNDLDACPGFDDTVDSDGDGVPDGCDPCPTDNPDDTDADGVCDSADICPGGDDSVDTDVDGVPDFCDICPGFDDTLDADADGAPNGCDICPGFDDTVDADADGVPDGCDNCIDTSNPDQTDADGDDVGDACDDCDNSNNDCADALLVTEGQTDFCNEQATTDGPQDCLGNGFVRDVWFRYVAPAAGILTVDTCTGITFDTVIEAYTGGCVALIPGPCDNDTVCPPGSSIDVPVSFGEEILIRVGGFLGGTFTGTGVLTLTFTCNGMDSDGDGDLDLDDYRDFEACLLGPGGGIGPGCDCFDSDNDGYVTLEDFGHFQLDFTGN